VRAVLSGLEGWLLETDLRGTERFVPAVTATAAVEQSTDYGRRFGESGHRS
jgi:hypothetical protein